jgi:hypothetical protein
MRISKTKRKAGFFIAMEYGLKLLKKAERENLYQADLWI